MTTEIIRSRRNVEVGDLIEGRAVIEKELIMPPNEKLKRLGVYDYTVESEDVQEPVEAPIKAKKSRKMGKDPGFIRIDMSTVSPINGPSLVLFRNMSF